ncbi:MULTISPECIES: RICIN domain-containing protein [Streptomyces]|uniref:RICIN domain-containing protein n=1 Tax=Streptomyces TaxID=1883 RepID=UPI001EE676CF|nr:MULTISPECIES: RICIN domain-containing protein [Streptomyces]
MRIRSACAVVAVALSATVLGVSTADATGPLSGTKIRNWQTGFVLGVAGNSTVGGTSIQYQTDTNELAQKWAIDPVTSGTFLLRNLNSDMCVTAVGGGGSEPLQQRPCDPRWDEQIFSMEASSRPNRYQLRNQAYGLCVNPDVAGVNANARVIGCSTANNYNTHSFEVR